MKAIVVADKCWNIGKNGRLLAYLPKDLAYFKKKTEGKTVVMGRLTYESLPGQKPLSFRTNVIMTRNPEAFLEKFSDRVSGFKTGEVFVVKDDAELFGIIGNYGLHSSRNREIEYSRNHNPAFGGECLHSQRHREAGLEDVFVIGGGKVYRLLLPYCDEIYVTKIDQIFEDADTDFPDLDLMPEWQIVQESEEHTENGMTYRFMTYRHLDS